MNRHKLRVLLLLAQVAMLVLTACAPAGETGEASEVSAGEISADEETGEGSLLIKNGTTPLPGEFDAVGTVPGCSATLITEDLVLTAAHCVCPKDYRTTGCATKTTFVLHEVYPVDDPTTSTDESQERKDISIEGIVRIHPEYEQRGWAREDIAVIELSQSVSQLAQNVQPIAVEEPENTPLIGDILTLVGYGRTGADCTEPGTGKLTTNLAVSQSNFGRIWFKYEDQGACRGDSGGPALNAAGHVVGVASWVDSNESNYRPTGFSYNWIFGYSRPAWNSCSWVDVERAGINSHQPGPDWCPNGSFLVAFDLDGNQEFSAHDEPEIGAAYCCTLEGAENAEWDSCEWMGVEQRGIRSHQPGPAWCPNGSYITQIDLDTDHNMSANDSPVIGQVRCCKLDGEQYMRWGSSYWVGIEVLGISSREPGEPWCQEGAFLTQFDLDGDHSISDYDAPVVGQAKCSRQRP